MVKPKVDEEGFLTDFQTWDADLAKKTASEHGITLTDEHWLVIHAVRGFYESTGVSPSMRPLVNVVKVEVGPHLGNSLKLIELFTNKTTRRIAQIGGLPKPADCI